MLPEVFMNLPTKLESNLVYEFRVTFDNIAAKFPPTFYCFLPLSYLCKYQCFSVIKNLRLLFFGVWALFLLLPVFRIFVCQYFFFNSKFLFNL